MIGVLVLFSLLIVLTVPLYGKQDFGGDCLSCHTQGGITIASNASEPIVVSPSGSFGLELTASGETHDLTVIWPPVSNNPSFGIAPSVLVDDGPGDSNSAEGKVKRTFQITAPASQGKYTVRVLAAGSGAMGGEMTCDVIVKEAPLAGQNLGPAPYFLHRRIGMTVEFGDRSWDPDGNITFWHWDFGDGSNLTWINHCNLTEEELYDQCNLTTDNECSFHEENPDEHCNFTEANLDEHCNMTAEDHNCNAMGEMISHTFSEPGSYVVSLTVSDDRGGTSTYSVPVNVPGEGELLRLWALQVFLLSAVMVSTTVFVTGVVASNGKPKHMEEEGT
jgi:hypothetical protein